MIKKLVLLGLLLGLIWACKGKVNSNGDMTSDQAEELRLPYFNTVSLTPVWDKPVHKIPPYAFINQFGDTISQKDYEGKIYIANFFFTTCPGICPRLTKNMLLLQDKYEHDATVMFLSHTVMPWVDTPEVLATYALKNKINTKQWHLVTGDKEALYNIARTGYFADQDFTATSDDDSFIHTENFVLVDTNGHIRGVYNGTLEIEVDRIERHIELLKSELN